MSLPYECEARETIREGLKEESRIASELLDLAAGVFTSGQPMNPSDGVDDMVKLVALSVLAKATKQYRAVMELVAMGLGETADGATRMLFETMLAAQFLLLRRVRLKRGEKKTAIPMVPGKPLTTKFRSQLYIANSVFNGSKFARGLAETQGLKRKLKKSTRQETDLMTQDWEQKLGAVWSKRVKENGYAGVKVIDLARSLGYETLYPSMYRPASEGVHATDALRHVRIDEETGEIFFKLAPDREGVANTLRFASLLLFKILDISDERLGLGLRSQLDPMLDRINAMKLEFPEPE